MTDELEMRSAVLEVAREANGPIRSTDLWRRASQRVHRMTPFAIAAMRDLVAEGVLSYDASAMVTVIERADRPLISDETLAEVAAMEERDRLAGGPPWEVPDHPDHGLPGGWHRGQIR